MFTAMLPVPGTPVTPVPAPVNMATLLAESYVNAGKSLQALGRDDEAKAQFNAATAFGPKQGVPNVIGRFGSREESNFAANAGGKTAEAYMELAKGRHPPKGLQRRLKIHVASHRTAHPQNRLREANDIQMQIAHGMRGW